MSRLAERVKKKAPQAPAVPQHLLNQVAVSSISIPTERLLSALDTFKSLQQAPKDEVLKGNQTPARFKMSSPAYGRTNAAARNLFVEAAQLRKLQSPLFEALQVQFSEELQAALCFPVSIYDETQEDQLQVTWSRDGTEMRCDFAYALIPKQWGVPRKMYRWVPIGLFPDLPKIGTAIVLDLKASWLEPKGKRETKENEKTQENGKARENGKAQEGGQKQASAS